MKLIDRIKSLPWVEFVDDERNMDNGIIVMLKEGWAFTLDPHCGVRGFDSMSEAANGCSKQDVCKKLYQGEVKSF